MVFNSAAASIQLKYWFMGQEPVKKKALTEQVFQRIFESDPRLT